jgi:hypothetical protein
MAENYYFDLNAGGVQLVLVDESNTWEGVTNDDCSIIPSGIIKEEKNPKKLICLSETPGDAPVVILHGASWETKVGDVGNVEGHAINGCNPTKWHLVLKT